MSDTTNDKRIVVRDDMVIQIGHEEIWLELYDEYTVYIDSANQSIGFRSDRIDDMIALLTAAKAEMARRDAGR